MNLNAAQVQSYRAQGYLVVPEIFAPDQAKAMIGHYMELRAQGPHPGDSGGTDDQPDDPNHTYPRMINMHDWDPASATWATRPDLLAAVEQLIDDEPVLRQTMLYFKPPGGRRPGPAPRRAVHHHQSPNRPVDRPRPVRRRRRPNGRRPRLTRSTPAR